MAKPPFVMCASAPDHAPDALKELIQKWLDAANATVEFVFDPNADDEAATAAFDMAMFAASGVVAPMVARGNAERREIMRKFGEALEEQIKAFSAAHNQQVN